MIAGERQTEEAQADSVGTADDLRTDNRGLRTEKIGKYLLQGITADVVIAVTGGRSKMTVRDHVLLIGLKDASGAMFLNGVDAGELLLQGSFCIGNAFLNRHDHSPCVNHCSSCW